MVIFQDSHIHFLISYSSIEIVFLYFHDRIIYNLIYEIIALCFLLIFLSVIGRKLNVIDEVHSGAWIFYQAPRRLICDFLSYSYYIMCNHFQVQCDWKPGYDNQIINFPMPHISMIMVIGF
jgi:hypothetical protein